MIPLEFAAKCADCRRLVTPDWDTTTCPCGAVTTCATCDPDDVCTDCRDLLNGENDDPR